MKIGVDFGVKMIYTVNEQGSKKCQKAPETFFVQQIILRVEREL